MDKGGWTRLRGYMKRSIKPADIAVIVVLALMLLGGGLWVGSLIRGNAVDRLAADGGLFEVHLVDGTVYLGELVMDEEDFLSLERPAVVLPQAQDGSEMSGYVVEPLSADPYSIRGPILIERGGVAFIGAVSPDSAIEGAYLQVMESDPQATPRP
jgi:hypothetical protein